jgi:hypothetical protein
MKIEINDLEAYINKIMREGLIEVYILEVINPANETSAGIREFEQEDGNKVTSMVDTRKYTTGLVLTSKLDNTLITYEEVTNIDFIASDEELESLKAKNKARMGEICQLIGEKCGEKVIMIEGRVTP